MFIQCYRCKKHKALFEFDKCKSGFLGVHSYCRECRKSIRKDLKKHNITRGKVGRPKGYRMSHDSISRISRAKTGRMRDQKTKDKISDSLRKYHAEQNPLTNDLRRDHRSSEARAWINTNKDAINDSVDILTTSRHKSIVKNYEIPIGDDIEWVAVDYRSPEYWLLLKEEARLRGVDMYDLINIIEEQF